MLITTKNVFVDLSMIFDTDTFVCKKLIDMMNQTNNPNDPFSQLKLAANSMDDIKLKNLFQVKKDINPLVDYYKSNSDENYSDIKEFCHSLYNVLLYDKSYTLEDFKDFKLTMVGNMLKVLILDKNLNKIYVFSEDLTDPLHDTIFSIFEENLDKVELIYGVKYAAIKGTDCDEFFFSDVTDITYVMNECTKNKQKHVYVPEYHWNMDEENPSRVRTPIDMNKLISDYHIYIESMRLPIV